MQNDSVVVMFACDLNKSDRSMTFVGVYTDGIALRDRIYDVWREGEVLWKGKDVKYVESKCINDDDFQQAVESIGDEINKAPLAWLQEFVDYLYLEEAVVMD